MIPCVIIKKDTYLTNNATVPIIKATDVAATITTILQTYPPIVNQGEIIDGVMTEVLKYGEKQKQYAYNILLEQQMNLFTRILNSKILIFIL